MRFRFEVDEVLRKQRGREKRESDRRDETRLRR
jgi:hypothetical protein